MQMTLRFMAIGKYENSLDLRVALSECIDDVANHLKLNVSKTEVIWFYNGRNLLRILRCSVRIVADSIISSRNVKSLDVWLDENLSTKTQINKILQCGFISLRHIKSIKDLLSLESLKKLASTLLLSRKDYGNVILAGLPKYQKNRL